MEDQNRSNKDVKDTFTMIELGKEVFPDLCKISSERKASELFRDICIKTGCDPENYKSGRDYAIPKGSLPYWKVLLRNYDIIMGKKTSSKKRELFIRELMEAKEEVDNNRTFESLYDVPFQRTMEAIYTLLYDANNNVKTNISAAYFDNIYKKMEEDLKYILDNAPEDRKVFYSEFYCEGVNAKIQEMSKLVRNMIDKKLYEHYGSELHEDGEA